MEKWKRVEGFGAYEVSDLGRVRRAVAGSTRRAGGLLQWNLRKGYAHVTLYSKSKPYYKRVNRLVAEAFIPNPLGLPQVNHIGDKADNRAIKLEWKSTAGHGRDKTLREQGGKGVHFHRGHKRWRATYYPKTNQQVQIGEFRTREEAEIARKAAMAALEE